MFGMSVFQSVLERLKTEEDEEETANAEVFATSRTPLFATTFVAGGADSASAARSAVERAYFDASFVEPAADRADAGISQPHQPCRSRRGT